MELCTLNYPRRYIAVCFIPGGLLLGSCGSDALISLERFVEPIQQKKVTVGIDAFCPQVSYRFRDFFASNLSAKIDEGILVGDWDRDGIPNTKDNIALLDLNFLKADSNGDGYSDILMWLGGYTTDQQKALKPCSNPGVDSDADGLNDCGAKLLRLDPQNSDYDGDGLPNYLEVRGGTNPLDPNDAVQDIDGDGLSNYLEVKLNTPIAESNNPEIVKLEYLYDTGLRIIGGKDCYDFKVTFPIVNVSNGNLAAFYILQVPIREVDENDNSLPPLLKSAQVVIPRATEDRTILKYSYSGLFN